MFNIRRLKFWGRTSPQSEEVQEVEVTRVAPEIKPDIVYDNPDPAADRAQRVEAAAKLDDSPTAYRQVGVKLMAFFTNAVEKSPLSSLKESIERGMACHRRMRNQDRLHVAG